MNGSPRPRAAEDAALARRKNHLHADQEQHDAAGDADRFRAQLQRRAARNCRRTGKRTARPARSAIRASSRARPPFAAPRCLQQDSETAGCCRADPGSGTAGSPADSVLIECVPSLHSVAKRMPRSDISYVDQRKSRALSRAPPPHPRSSRYTTASRSIRARKLHRILAIDMPCARSAVRIGAGSSACTRTGPISVSSCRIEASPASACLATP